MSQLQRTVKVAGRAISDPIRALHVRHELGQPLLIEVQFIAGAPPADPKKHFAEILGHQVTLELEDEGRRATLDGLVAQASVETTGYSLIGRGPLYGLTVARRSRGFAEQSPVQVIERVLTDAGVKHAVKQGITPLAKNRAPYIAQHQETDFTFIHRLAGWAGLVVYEDKGQVIVAEAPEGTAVSLKATDITSARLVLEPSSLAARAVVMDYAPHAVVTQSVEIAEANSSGYSSVLDAPAKALFAGAPALAVEAHPKTANDLADQLQTRARQLAASSIRYEFTTYHPQVQVGAVLDVAGHELISEKLFVVSMVIDQAPRLCVWDQDDPFAAKVIAVPAKMVGPVEPPAPARAGMVTAIISENKDPQKLGRVRLKFVWDDTATTWARVASYSAGAIHGAFWVPEVGDEVLVSFEFGDPSRPIVVGSLFHAQSLPKAETEDLTAEVLLARTKAGTEIRVVQAEKGERIRLRVGDGGPEICLSAGDAATVAITVEGGACNLKARKIAITAEEEVQIKGDKLSFESQGEITITASGKVQVKGSQIDLN